MIDSKCVWDVTNAIIDRCQAEYLDRTSAPPLCLYRQCRNPRADGKQPLNTIFKTSTEDELLRRSLPQDLCIPHQRQLLLGNQVHLWPARRSEVPPSSLGNTATVPNAQDKNQTYRITNWRILSSKLRREKYTQEKAIAERIRETYLRLLTAYNGRIRELEQSLSELDDDASRLRSQISSNYSSQKRDLRNSITAIEERLDVIDKAKKRAVAEADELRRRMREVQSQIEVAKRNLSEDWLEGLQLA